MSVFPVFWNRAFLFSQFHGQECPCSHYPEQGHSCPCIITDKNVRVPSFLEQGIPVLAITRARMPMFPLSGARAFLFSQFHG